MAYAPGPDEIELAIGCGVTIDSAEGLLEMDDLELGEAVTVYYDAVGDGESITYLLYQTS